MSTTPQTPTALDVPACSAPMTDTEAIALYVVMDAIKTLRIARGTLCNVAQLIGGWKTTTPPAEWSEWDEQTYQALIALMKRIEPNNLDLPRSSSSVGSGDSFERPKKGA